MKQLDVMFSPTARYSIAGTLTQIENTSERTRVNLATAHYNRLLRRRSGAESQFNGYLSVGAGLSRSNVAFQNDRDQPVAAIGARARRLSARIVALFVVGLLFAFVLPPFLG